MKLIRGSIHNNYVSDNTNNLNDKVLKRHFLLNDAENFPKIVNQATKHIDKISYDFILCCSLDLDSIQNSKYRFNSPAFPVFIDVEMLAFLSGICSKHPIVSFAVGKAAIPLDKHVPNFNFECGFIFGIFSHFNYFLDLPSFHLFENLVAQACLRQRI